LDHDKGQKADIKDNLDHYEVLLDDLAKEVPQVKKVGKNFVFTPERGGIVKELFQKVRSRANRKKSRSARKVRFSASSPRSCRKPRFRELLCIFLLQGA
jgi:hypothetical protein